MRNGYLVLYFICVFCKVLQLDVWYTLWAYFHSLPAGREVTPRVGNGHICVCSDKSGDCFLGVVLTRNRMVTSVFDGYVGVIPY